MVYFFMCLFISMSILCKSNKIETMTTEYENKIIHNYKMKKPNNMGCLVNDIFNVDKTISKTEDINLSDTRSYIEYEATVSFYSSDPSENGNFITNCLGENLKYGMVANNRLKLYQKVWLEGFGNMEIRDRGGSNFNNLKRFDVFIPKRKGEKNKDYLSRVNNMGIRKAKCRIYLEEE